MHEPSTATEPESFVDNLIRYGLIPPEKPKRARAQPVAPRSDAAPYYRKALEQEMAEVASTPEGGRNDQLNRSAFNLGQLVPHGLSEDEVFDSLTAAAHSTTGAPMSDTEIERTIRSGIEAGRQQPREAPELDLAHGDEIRHLSRAVDGAAFILDQPEALPTLWGRGDEVFWIEGEALMIAAPMGTGKTTMAGMLVGAQVRDGGEVLGMPVKGAGGRVLYLAMDRPRQIARAMARQFTENDRAVLQERLVVRPGPPPKDLARHPGTLLAMAVEHDATVVYVDSLKDAAIGLSEDEVGAGYNRARQTLLADGRQLCELHHTIKRGVNGQAPSTVADIYGSTWLTAGAGSVILLGGEPGDPIVSLRHVKQPASEIGPWQLLHDQNLGVMTIEHSVDLVALAASKRQDGLTVREAAIAITEKDKPSRTDVEKARRRLDSLTQCGDLTRVEGVKGGAKGGAPSAYFAA